MESSRPGFGAIAPIFPVESVPAALEHYAALGFRVRSWSDDYGFAARGKVELHLTRRASSRFSADAIGVAYLFVRDADVLFAEWSSVSVTEAPALQPWGMYEGTHTDPDGNVIRFGAPTGD